MRLPKEWTPHTVTVQPYVGEGAAGPIIGEPVTVRDVYVKDVTEVVLDGSGAEVVSRGTVRFNLEDLPSLDSRVTVWEGTPQEYTAVLFRTSRLQHPGWPELGVGWLK